jgi:hypothetical protein
VRFYKFVLLARSTSCTAFGRCEQELNRENSRKGIKKCKNSPQVVHSELLFFLRGASNLEASLITSAKSQSIFRSLTTSLRSGFRELAPFIGQAVALVLTTWAQLPLAMTAALSAWACVLGQRWVAAEEALG